MKKFALLSSYFLFISLLSFWIVSQRDHFPMLKAEDIVLNVVSTAVALLVSSYLLTPAAKACIRAIGRFKAGERVWKKQVETPTVKTSLIYKIILFTVAYSIFFSVVRVFICVLSVTACRQLRVDDFSFFVGFLVFSVALWALIRAIKMITYAIKNHRMLLSQAHMHPKPILGYGVVYTLCVMGDTCFGTDTCGSLGALTAHELMLALGVLVYYLLGLAFYRFCMMKYREVRARRSV